MGSSLGITDYNYTGGYCNLLSDSFFTELFMMNLALFSVSQNVTVEHEQNHGGEGCMYIIKFLLFQADNLH